MKKYFLLLTSCVCMTASSYARYTSAPTEIDYQQLNERAKKEYLQPIRPGYEKKNPYWNEFSFKFIYAPAFDFKSVKGAKNYRYTIKENPDATEKISGKTVSIINNKFKDITFFAETPNSSLAPVWNLIPAANVTLTVDALDAKGNVMETVGKRKFLRDFEFCGPYNNAVRPYKEAAIKGMLYIHNMPEVKCWLDSCKPDMTYEHYTYANKTLSAILSNEACVAKYVPAEREKALRIADSVAKFFIRISQPADAALAYFPPTYYKDLIASKREENKGTTMTMDANYAVNAFLDLYEVTHNKTYYDQALNIMRTYKKIQRKDGSFPIKVYIETGKPTNERNAMLYTVCVSANRFLKQYQVTEFQEMQKKAEEWMHNVAIRSFDITGQFEDVTVNNLKPYENLTNCTAAPYAKYLLSKENPSAEDMQDAQDLLKLSEDQFTYWNFLYNELGYRRYNTPCVIEQYKYKTPVDNSAANVSGGLLEYYKATGDVLAYAKAKAIIDNMTIQQNPKNGYLPTTWDCSTRRINELSIWLNCAEVTIERLLEMSQLQQ